MDQVDTKVLIVRSRDELLRRNQIFESFFDAEAPRLAEACHEMSRRFLAGGRLLAFGNGSAATDAQHVSVEFVHPVIVGKRALPALDLGPDFERRLPVLLRPEDMVMGFAFPEADESVERALRTARERGAMTFALMGEAGEYSFSPPDGNPFVIQEVFEVLYHVLWETVHVYFEHREQGHDVGNSSFLYPFLGKGQQPLDEVVREVQGSMLQKMQEVNRLRTAAAESEAGAISETAVSIAERLERGGQLIAHARAEDVAVGISTSGGSANILAALAEARRRGLLTVGIVGYDGGRIVAERLADHAVVVRSDYIPRIQEVQASIYHVLRSVVERRMA